MLSVGSDPEFFLLDPQKNLVSALGLLGGTKAAPRKTPHGYIQEDNVTAEVNSNPSFSEDEFVENHNLIMSDLQEIITPLDLSVDISGSALFSDKLLSHPDSQVAGCEPDFNVWKLAMNTPVNYQTTNLRAAGGHLHIGSDKMNTPTSKVAYCRALDMVLGVPSVIQDTDNLRRGLYGQAGSCRFKNKNRDGFNGIEYRVLSNFWMRSESMMRYIYSSIAYVDDNLEELSCRATELKGEIVSIINSGDVSKALTFCDREGLSYAS